MKEKIIANGQMEITILEDGTIKIETGNMAGTSHRAADEFVKTVSMLAGGDVTEEKIKKGHIHNHDHAHEGNRHHH